MKREKAAVPNGTADERASEAEQAITPADNDVTAPTVLSLVERWQRGRAKTIEGVLEQATALWAAHELGKGALKQFCEDIDLDQNSATFRKWKLIGEKASRFQPFMNRMPGNWTTVYQLARLKPQDFDKVASSGSFSPEMTWEDIAEIVGGG